MPDFLLTKQKGKDYLDFEFLETEARFKNNKDDEDLYIETLIDLSLSTNRNAKDVLNPVFNVGSVLELFDSIDGFKLAGSEIWSDSNRGLTDTTKSELESKATTALNWLINAGFVKFIDVVIIVESGARMIKVLTEFTNNTKKELKYNYNDYKFIRKI